jgi:hypothetical protein
MALHRLKLQAEFVPSLLSSLRGTTKLFETSIGFCRQDTSAGKGTGAHNARTLFWHHMVTDGVRAPHVLVSLTATLSFLTCASP